MKLEDLGKENGPGLSGEPRDVMMEEGGSEPKIRRCHAGRSQEARSAGGLSK